jgi:hypothetical protein
MTGGRDPADLRATVGRAAAVGAVVVAAIGIAVGFVSALREHDATADANASLDWADREVAWGNGWTLSQEALYAARSLIPAGADYQVNVAPADRFDDPLTGPFVANYLHSFLMPRHPRDRAAWIVCYRCDRPAGSAVVWADDDASVSILRREGANA